MRPALIDSDDNEISSTKCDTSCIYQDSDIARIPTPFVPQPTDGTLDPIHHVPFLQHYSDLDTRNNPNAALLCCPDATLQDNINGPLTMQHLPACVDTSITAATFCLRYITANLATKQFIRDLTTDHLRHFFRENHPVLLVNAATISDTDDSIEYIQCMQHTLNRTTNLVIDNLPDEMLHHFPHCTPASYLSLLNDHQPCSLGHECALAILYALKTLHLIHFLTFPVTQDAPYQYMPHDLSNIIRNVPSFATTLCLFPHRSNSRDVPAFIHTFFQDQQVATNPFERQQDSQQSSYKDHPTHLGSSFLIAFTHSPLVNGFGNPTPGISPRSSLAYQLHSNTMHIYLPRAPMVMTQICNLPTSFLDTYLQLICSSTTIVPPSQWLHYQQLSNSTMLPNQRTLQPP